jgi:hypothetical protein
MDLSHFDGALWLLSLVGQLLLAFVMLRTKLYREFPIFSSYILYASISDVCSFILFRHASERVYFWVYFSNNIPELMLQIGILVEMARNVLSPVKRSLPRASLYIFGVMLVAGTALALLLSMHSQPADLDRWAQYFLHINFAVAILRLAIFAAIAGFSQLLGIGWKNHVLQIAGGFLTYSIAVLMVQLLHRYTYAGVMNQDLSHLHEQLRIIVWCMVLGYWSYALSRGEATRREFSPKMAQFLISMSEAARETRTASARWYRK